MILAAGGSTRLGRPKQLLPWRGRTLLRHAAEQALTSSCRPVVVVLGAIVDECERELAGLDVQVAINPAWADGMGSSIRTGIAALTRGSDDADGTGEGGDSVCMLDAAIVMLCDQPLVTGAFLDELSEAHVRTGRATIAAAYSGQPGVPALFGRSRFAELAELDRASGAKRLLRDPSAETLTLACPQAAIDVDTMADYEAAQATLPESR
jgi:molybdenum cofactor cytidylyltransferase